VAEPVWKSPTWTVDATLRFTIVSSFGQTSVTVFVRCTSAVPRHSDAPVRWSPRRATSSALSSSGRRASLPDALSTKICSQRAAVPASCWALGFWGSQQFPATASSAIGELSVGVDPSGRDAVLAQCVELAFKVLVRGGHA
jgi:hypothetical protein